MSFKKNRGPADIRRVRVLPNWADCDTIKPLESSANPLRSDWELSNHFVIGYSGNLSRAHDIETLLEAISAIDDPMCAVGLSTYVSVGHQLGVNELGQQIFCAASLGHHNLITD